MVKALVIEDNRLNRKLLRDVLEIRFEVEEAVTAEEALALVQIQKPDLILTDIQLPGMSGLEFTRLLKGIAELKDVPVVAISAFAESDSIKAALESGCVEYVTKPIVEDPFVLVERFEKLVSESQQ